MMKLLFFVRKLINFAVAKQKNVKRADINNNDLFHCAGRSAQMQ